MNSTKSTTPQQQSIDSLRKNFLTNLTIGDDDVVDGETSKSFDCNQLTIDHKEQNDHDDEDHLSINSNNNNNNNSGSEHNPIKLNHIIVDNVNNNNNNNNDIDVFKRTFSVRTTNPIAKNNHHQINLNMNNDNNTSKLMISHGKPNFIINPIMSSKRIIDNNNNNNESSIDIDKIKRNLHKTGGPPTSPTSPKSPTTPSSSSSSIIITEENGQQSIDEIDIPIFLDNEISRKLRSLRKTQTAPRLRYYSNTKYNKNTNNKLSMIFTDPVASESITPHNQIDELKNLNIKPSTSQYSRHRLINPPSSISGGGGGGGGAAGGKTTTFIPSKLMNHHHHHLNHGSPNYEQKSIVSFSRDLANTPNRYPDTIKVTTFIQPDENTPNFKLFKDIKFTIDSNCDVNKL